jgi:hypothetical protein
LDYFCFSREAEAAVQRPRLRLIVQPDAVDGAERGL